MIMRIPILKSILRNLDWFEEAQKHHKAPEGTIFVGGINHRLKKEDWVEQKHPRADDGKFTSGSGGGSKKPSKTKRKMERREGAASQARVGGAIQSLLSGGSALDKIGWLKTPEKQPESEKPKAKPPAQKKPKLPSESDLIGTGVTDQNYREFLDRGIENLSRNEYIAAKQSQYYVEQNGKVLSTQAAAKLYDQEKVKPTEPAKRPNAVPTNEELDASGVYDQNYKDYLKKPPESLSLAEYVAAKQSQYYVERGDILSAETAADWYHAAVAEAAKKPATQSDIKVEDGEVAGSKILSLGNKRAGVMQHSDGSFVVLSQVDRKTVDRKEFKHLDVANRYAEAWLKGGQQAPQQPEKPKAEEKPKAKVSLADQATKLKLKDLKELSLGKLRSMQSALQKHPKFRNPAYPEGKKYDKALRMVEGAIYSKV